MVEDDAAIRDVVSFAMTRAGFEIGSASTVAAARRQIQQRLPDLIILDLGLPDGDGLDLCRELRRTSNIPVLMLTCRDQEIDRVLGLETGADDYVVKPFSTRELVARVRSILRRAQRSGEAPDRNRLQSGRLVLQIREHRVLLDDLEVGLTAIEFKVLQALLASPTRVFSRLELIERVYEGHCFVSERTIDSHVKGIRSKFAAVDKRVDPVETVFGVGYRAREIL